MAKRDRGTASFAINGEVYDLFGDLKYSVTKESAELVRGVDGHAGTKYTPKNCYIEGTFTNSSDVDTGVFSGLTDLTVQATLRNGKIVTLPQATQVGEVEVDPIEGTYTLRFESAEGQEVTV